MPQKLKINIFWIFRIKKNKNFLKVGILSLKVGILSLFIYKINAFLFLNILFKVGKKI